MSIIVTGSCVSMDLVSSFKPPQPCLKHALERFSIIFNRNSASPLTCHQSGQPSPSFCLCRLILYLFYIQSPFPCLKRNFCQQNTLCPVQYTGFPDPSPAKHPPSCLHHGTTGNTVVPIQRKTSGKNMQSVSKAIWKPMQKTRRQMRESLHGC